MTSSHSACTLASTFGSIIRRCIQNVIAVEMEPNVGMMKSTTANTNWSTAKKKGLKHFFKSHLQLTLKRWIGFHLFEVNVQEMSFTLWRIVRFPLFQNYILKKKIDNIWQPKNTSNSNLNKCIQSHGMLSTLFVTRLIWKRPRNPRNQSKHSAIIVAVCLKANRMTSASLKPTKKYKYRCSNSLT